MTKVNQQKVWRMNCDVGEVMERLENAQSTHTHTHAERERERDFLEHFFRMWE